MKYRNWLNEWLTLYVKPTAKTRTYEKYSRQVKKHISPKLGEYEMEELSALVLQKFTVELTEEGFSSNTVNSVITVIKSSLARAAMLGAASEKHFDAIVRPKSREKQIECFAKDEQRKIEQYINDSKKDKLFGITICLYTGLRIGELLALTWSDADLGKGIITIKKSCHDEWHDGKYVKAIETPKTSNSYRVVPIPKTLLPRLKGMKKRARGEYVISGRTEQGAEVRNYQRTFKTLLKKLNIPHKGLHALRHTFATRALEVGMDVKTLSEILGHGSPAITLKRYVHSMLEHKTEMMNRVGEIFPFGTL